MKSYVFIVLVVEWSGSETFEDLLGSQVLDEPFSYSSSEERFYYQYEMQDLAQGGPCYVRVSASNVKGFGPSASSNPPFAKPSSRCLAL